MPVEAHLEAFLGHFKHILRPSWVLWGPSLGPCGPFGAHREVILGLRLDSGEQLDPASILVK